MLERVAMPPAMGGRCRPGGHSPAIPLTGCNNEVKTGAPVAVIPDSPQNLIGTDHADLPSGPLNDRWSRSDEARGDDSGVSVTGDLLGGLGEG